MHFKSMIFLFFFVFSDNFQGSDAKGVLLIQSWTESQPRQDFSYPVMLNDSYTFSWAFQKLQLGQGKLEDDVAKIYCINVTNTIDGGAAMCLPCHQVSVAKIYCINVTNTIDGVQPCHQVSVAKIYCINLTNTIDEGAAMCLPCHQMSVAKIYCINVTNTVDGGAAMCLPCHQVSVSNIYIFFLYLMAGFHNNMFNLSNL